MRGEGGRRGEEERGGGEGRRGREGERGEGKRKKVRKIRKSGSPKKVYCYTQTDHFIGGWLREGRRVREEGREEEGGAAKRWRGGEE